MKKNIKKILDISPLKLWKIILTEKNNKVLQKKNKILFDKYFSNNEVRKLQIGCGSNLLEGWLNTDLHHSNDVAYLNAAEFFPFENESIDFIFSEHLFEHLNIHQQINMIKECWRVLKIDGVLRIATPSLEFLADLYNSPENHRNKKYIYWAVDNIPGLEPVKMNIKDESVYQNYVINHFFKAWGHQMIHDSESLKNLVQTYGFKKVNKVKVGESELSDLRYLERHGEIIPSEMNLLETMVVEVIK